MLGELSGSMERTVLCPPDGKGEIENRAPHGL